MLLLKLWPADSVAVVEWRATSVEKTQKYIFDTYLKYQEVHPMNIDSVKINTSLKIRDYEVDGSFRSQKKSRLVLDKNFYFSIFHDVHSNSYQ